ncbi:MAG: EamA family transporter [Paracoccaceae bacterium]
MSVTVFLAVLFAALLHASWNAVIKTGGDRFQGMLLLTLSQGVMGLIMAMVFAWPAPAAWPWLLASGILHTAYKLFLAAAYGHGDLSRVYPIARGTAPMIVALIGVFVLADAVSGVQYASIAAVGFGVVLMAQGVFSNGEARRLLPLALGSALCTAGYSLVDGIGARLALDAAAFTGWMFFLDAVFFVVAALFWRGKPVFMASGAACKRGALAGALSLGAYWIVVWAMTKAPIALVASLRETSVLFAMLIGVFIMRERADTGKWLAGGLILCGVLLMRL